VKKLAVLLTAAVVACGSKQPQTQLTPTLPGEGNEHTAKPVESGPPAPPDPWQGKADLIQAPAPKPPQKLELPPVERFTLPNGLQVIVVKDPRLPIVSMQLAVKAGRADEPPAHLGIAEFTADMLVKGTKKRKALDIAKAVDFVGGGITVDASFEATIASCKVMSKNLPMCLDVLPDIIEHPTFPADEMNRVREQLIAEVRQRYDDAGTLGSLHVQNLLWSDDHVRGRVVDEAAVRALQQDDLVKWHDIWFSPGNAVLAVAGDIDPKKVKAQLTTAFGGWKNAKVPPHIKYPDPKLSGVKIRLVDKPHQSQTQIRIAQLGIRHDDPRFFATLVWNYVLGGGDVSSRLMNAVRVKGGKTYGASSTFDRNQERGSFVAETFTRNSEAVATTKLVLAEIAKMAKDGPTDTEVSDAIANITGGYGVRFESAGDLTGALLGAELHGFNEDYITGFPLRIGAVTAADAKAAAHEILDPSNFVIVLVGDAADIAPQLDKEGWKYEKVTFTDPIGHPAELAPAPPDAKQEAAARKLLDDALAAKGGEAKLRAIKSEEWQAKGTLAGLGPDGSKQSLNVEVHRRFVAPAKSRIDIKLQTPQGAVSIAYAVAGDKGWQQSPKGVVDMPGEQLDLLAQQEWTDAELVLLRYKDKDAVLRPLPDQTVDGVDTALVNVTVPSSKLTVTLFIDKKTHLVKQLAYPAPGGITFDVFDDYKDVDGVKVAHHRINRSEEEEKHQVVEEIDLTLSDVKLNGKIGDDAFARPSGPSAAPAGGQ
jgi:zinc protease